MSWRRRFAFRRRTWRWGGGSVLLFLALLCLLLFACRILPGMLR